MAVPYGKTVDGFEVQFQVGTVMLERGGSKAEVLSSSRRITFLIGCLRTISCPYCFQQRNPVVQEMFEL
jgi:hypothetical protein